MPIDLDLQILHSPLLDVQQFTAADVLAATGLTAGQLKGILDRSQITLSQNHNPGTGRRRMFTGKDIIALSAVRETGLIGFPLRWGNVLAQQVNAHAVRLHLEKAHKVQTPHLMLAFYPSADGEDWAFAPLSDETDSDTLPTAFQVLDVTRNVNQTMAKLQAIIDDQPLPDFTPPQPPEKPDNLFAPRSNFMKLWEKDGSGAWRYVGLTFDETKVLMADEGIVLDGEDLKYVDRVRNEDRELIAALTERREAARLMACAMGDSDQ